MDRKEAIEYAKFRLECHTKGDGEYTDYGEFLVAAIEALSEPPRLKGRWIDKPTGAYRRWQSWCSACGQRSGVGGIESNRHKPFRPNCGADMRGEEE